MTQEISLSQEQLQVARRLLDQRIEMNQGPITELALIALIGHAIIVHSSLPDLNSLVTFVESPEHTLTPTHYEVVAEHLHALRNNGRTLEEIRKSTEAELKKPDKKKYQKLAKRIEGILPK